jgi:hypothetical protein
MAVNVLAHMQLPEICFSPSVVATGRCPGPMRDHLDLKLGALDARPLLGESFL